jgi:hypothetical protein
VIEHSPASNSIKVLQSAVTKILEAIYEEDFAVQPEYAETERNIRLFRV